AGFDSPKGHDDEAVAVFRDECGADQFGQDERYTIIEQRKPFKIAKRKGFSCTLQFFAFHFVLRDVLKLNTSPCPAPCSTRAAKLQDSANAPVGADRLFHCFVLFYRRFSEF